jgi:hypothetical protein
VERIQKERKEIMHRMRIAYSQIAKLELELEQVEEDVEGVKVHAMSHLPTDFDFTKYGIQEDKGEIDTPTISDGPEVALKYYDNKKSHFLHFVSHVSILPYEITLIGN